MTPYQLVAPFDPEPVLSLIRGAFAFMEGRIDPPSSMNALSGADLLRLSQAGEIWVVGAPPLACCLLTPRGDALYLGKLSVAEAARGRGLARLLIDHATTRAQALGLPAVELQTRVELTENQALFRHLGFVETARTAHAGYDRPTSITYRRPAG